MCIDYLREIVLDKDTYAYKVVSVNSAGNYQSQVPLSSRLRQTGYKGLGGLKRYRVGHWVRSNIPETPGIYLYRTFTRARYHTYGSARRMIKVFIPAGTKVMTPAGHSVSQVGKFTAARCFVVRDYDRLRRARLR